MDPAYTELVVERAGAPWRTGAKIGGPKSRPKSTPLGGCFQLRNLVAAGEPPRQVGLSATPCHMAKGCTHCRRNLEVPGASTPTMSLENDT